MNFLIDAHEVRREEDVVFTRQRARHVAAAIGFDGHDQTRIATAVSEVARTALFNAGGCGIEFLITGETEQSLLVRLEEHGPGRHALTAILDGRVSVPKETAFGLVAARRLMDRFRLDPDQGSGATLQLEKALPRQVAVLLAADIARIAAELAARTPEDPSEELRRQNQELLHALSELRDRQAELAQLNRELEETNRGVVALYAELDEKADSLRRASELKSRFLSHMSHEFRSPLNSILSLTRFLLERTDGDLVPEQEKQVRFIVKAADGMLSLVNDLLDLAKVEAGKVDVYAEPFEVSGLFSTLRGMFRPIVASEAVDLIFVEPVGVPTLVTDEGKLSQILRNFLSNALKFTEQGEIKVSAICCDDAVTFAVSDTGIGIAVADQERVFDEFVQVESPTQRRIKGTGLGLPLSRKLAELLGGSVSVRSSPGVGSTFSVVVPRVFAGMSHGSAGEVSRSSPASSAASILPRSALVLIIDDDEAARYVLKNLLFEIGLRVVESAAGDEGLRLAQSESPQVIILDLAMPGMSGAEVLERLKAEEQTCEIPVVIHTSQILDEAAEARLNGAAAFLSKSSFAKPGGMTQLRNILSELCLQLTAEKEA